MVLALDEFAEGFAWYVHVDKQLATGLAPAFQAAFNHPKHIVYILDQNLGEVGDGVYVVSA